MNSRVLFLRPARGRRPTAGSFLNRRAALTKRISPIWRTLTWAGEPGWQALGTSMFRLPRCFTREAAQADPDTTSFKVSLSSRNNIYMIWKNMPFFQLLLNLPFLLAGFGLKFLFFLKKGMGATYMKGLKEGFQMCGNGRKVKFQWKHLPFYVKIQLELWINIVKRFG